MIFVLKKLSLSSWIALILIEEKNISKHIKYIFKDFWMHQCILFQAFLNAYKSGLLLKYTIHATDSMDNLYNKRN